MRCLLLIILVLSVPVFAMHEGHIDERMVDGGSLDIDPQRYDRFVADLAQVNIAIVSVKGMVCDFCARGIEKIFGKDKQVKKIDVDLAHGKVLIAYNKNKRITFEEIEKNILKNGLNATDLEVLEL